MLVIPPDIQQQCRLYVPASSVSKYANSTPWSEFIILNGSTDVNGDGEINIADINSVIDCILKGNQTSSFDVNGDGEVNIADINDIVDCILKR